MKKLGVTCIIGLVLGFGHPVLSANILDGSTEQGVFQMAGGRADLSQDGKGVWELRFTLPPGSAAGIWTKSLTVERKTNPAHALSYALTLDSAEAAVLPVTWELKGSAGIQSIPMVLRAGTRCREVALDWNRIGNWGEGVLAVSHPGGRETISGVIRIQAGLIRWPLWHVVMAHPWGRWFGLLLVAVLAVGFRKQLGVAVVPGLGARSVGLGIASVLAVISVLALLGDADTLPGQWLFTPFAVTLAGMLVAGILTRCLAGRWPTRGEVLQHTLLSGLLVFAAGDLPVWTMTRQGSDLIRLSRIGAALFWVFYQGVNAHHLMTRRQPLGATAGIRLVVIPFLFGLLLLLPNPDLMSRLGAYSVSLGISMYSWMPVVAGRTVVLAVFNLAAALACLGSLKALRARSGELAVLPVLALAVAMSPWVADLGSGSWILPVFWQPLAVIGFTMLSQGALWAEAYVLTGLLLKTARGGGVATVEFSSDAWQGFRKGMSFSGWFMGLLQAGNWLAGFGPWVWAQAQAPVVAWAVLGAAVFPLVKTVMETFDGSPSYIRRLWSNARRSALPWRGALLGGCLAWAWGHRAIEWILPERAGYGFAVGVLVYAGISLLRDLKLTASGHGRVAGVRVYAVEAALGGLVGAALGFYLDAAQTPVITHKLAAYLKIGGTPVSYEVYPLLSRWGFLPLGEYAGGARLLWNEALAGVISWGVAAWLFALNRSALLAVMQREWAPLRRVFSREGVTELAEGTIYVLRWGLWMAPIIFTFLRQMPTATWYNQDGAVRTLCCVWQSLWLDPQAFQAWSLQVFLGVLAYDALRVLIWLDHMGLRVATLVNLSFLGMEQLDARVARFLGPPATARCFPEGIKRFTTWAPLLLPFYIPAGGAWDQVWTQSQAIRMATPSWLEQFWGQSLRAGLWEGGGVVVGIALVIALAGHRKRSGSTDFRLALRNEVFAFTLNPDGAVRSEVLAGGIEIHRPAHDGCDPAGRAVFLSEARPGGGWDAWPVLGNFPAEIGPQAEWTGDDRMLTGVHRGHGLETEVRITLPNQTLALEAWTVTIRNPGSGPRSVRVVPYVEWMLSTIEADRGHTQYNRLFPEVSYEPGIAAVVAFHRLSKIAGFLAADRAPEGFHSERVDFLGRAGTLWAPEALTGGHWRPPAPMAPCPMFDAMAALSLRVEVPAGGSQTVRWWVGAASSREAATALVRRTVPADIPVSRGAVPGPKLDHGTPPRDFSGHYTEFTNGGRTMRILTPFTPRPFDHTMANRLGHVMAVTQRGLHTSSSVNSQQNRLTPDWADLVTRELPGEAFYLYEPEMGEWFSPTYEPLRDRHAAHDVEFGVDGAAVFRMHRGALATELTVFVPPDEPLGVYRLTIRNDGDQPRRLVCASYFEMVLAARPEHAGPLLRGSAAGGRGLWFENPRNTFRSGSAFVAMTPAPGSVVTRRGDFFGPDRTPAHPVWVEGGSVMPEGSGDEQPVAGFRLTLDLPPHGERQVVVVLGQADTREEAERLMERYADPVHAQTQLEVTRDWWNAYGGALEVETSDPGVDGFLHWLKYQALAERLWARKGFYQASGAFGFRDQLQDAVNLIWVDPGLARRQILVHAAQQFVEGDAAHWFFLQQDGRTGLACRSHASDNLLWLAWAVADYVRMTGDGAVLDERIPYLDTEIPLSPLPAGRGGLGLFPLRSPVEESLFSHVRRALDLVLDHRLGYHGLPLIGTGDWNDSFDEIGVEGRGESVWLGFFLLSILKELLPVFETRCEPGRAARYRQSLESLRGALEETWRTDRYLRAIHDDGTEIGLPGGGAWEVDALTAAWAVMAGMDPVRARMAFDTAVRLLERGPVILLGWPPVLETTKPRFGRVAQYPAGVRENGMYCHGVQWLVGAARLLSERCEAEGDRVAAAGYRATAVRLWRKISPLAHTTPDRIEVYGGQPNKQAADLLTEIEPGRMIWSGYTGAAAWMLRQALEGVIGARLQGNQVRLPADLNEPRGDLQVRGVRRFPFL